MGLVDLLPPELQALAVHDGWGRWLAEQFPTSFSAKYRNTLQQTLRAEDPLVQAVAIERVTAYVERGKEAHRAVQNDSELLRAFFNASATELQESTGFAPPVVASSPDTNGAVELHREVKDSIARIDTVLHDGTLFRFGYRDAIRDQLERISAVRSLLDENRSSSGVGVLPDLSSDRRMGEMISATFQALQGRIHSTYFWRSVFAPCLGAAFFAAGMTKSLYAGAHSFTLALTVIPATVGLTSALVELASGRPTENLKSFVTSAEKQVKNALTTGKKAALATGVLAGIVGGIVDQDLVKTLAGAFVGTLFTVASLPLMELSFRVTRKRIHAEFLKVSAALDTSSLDVALKDSHESKTNVSMKA